MNRESLKFFISNIFIISIISFGIVVSKPMTLEKVEDLRLNMIEKKNKRSLLKLIGDVVSGTLLIHTKIFILNHS